MRKLMRLGAFAAPLLVLLMSNAAAQQNTPYLKLAEPQEWTLRIAINVRGFQNASRPDELPEIDWWDFDTAAIVFPINDRTAAHQILPSALKGEIFFEDQLVSNRTELITGYPAGTRLGKWTMTGVYGRQFDLKLEIGMTCWETEFDEAAASQVDWPTGEWPQEAKTCFEPQAYLDMAPDGRGYDMRYVERLLKTISGGRDPESARKQVKPVPMAKWIAGNVLERFQINGNGLQSDRTGKLQGFDVQGAAGAAQRRRGSEFDMNCLLVALYREAGLPARVVIGYEAEDEDGSVFSRGGGNRAVRSWAEFCLYDEARASITWVPVDVPRMRKRSSRMARNYMEQPQKFFGTHDELDVMCPIAFQFHPPTTVRAYGSPGLWGWLVTPQAPERAWQTLDFQTITTPKRSNEPARDRERRRYE